MRIRAVVAGWAKRARSAISARVATAWRDAERLALFYDLWQKAKRLGIVVAWSAGQLHRGRDWSKGSRGRRFAPYGSYNDEARCILLAPGHWFCPWTLAHEIGHYALYRRVGARHTEKQADAEAWRIIESGKGIGGNVTWSLRKEMERELGKAPRVTMPRRRTRRT